MKNFQDWAEHPETTTIETLPIEKAPFPRVTVCPPKNTFTNLNYDLLYASNASWSKAKRHSFVDSLFSRVLDFEFSVALNLYIEEDSNGFRNWYDGLTMNSHPFDSSDGKQKVTTYALSGSMSTPLFSERFNISAFQNPKVDESFEYDMEIDIGMLSEDNRQLYFNIEIDGDTFEDREMVYVCGKKAKLPWDKNILIHSNCPKGQTKCVYCPNDNKENFKTEKYLVTFKRFNINENDVYKMKVYNKSMTGMRVSWSIMSSESNSSLIAKVSPEIASNNKDFKDFVHVVGNFSGSKMLLWEIIKDIKRDSTRDDPNGKRDVSETMEKIKQNLTKQSVSPINAGDHPSDDLLNMAGKMFIYIKTIPRKEWIDTLKQINDNFIGNKKKYSPKTLLLMLSNFKAKGDIVGESIRKILFESASESLSDISNFVFDKLDDLTCLDVPGPDLTTEVKG